MDGKLKRRVDLEKQNAFLYSNNYQMDTSKYCLCNLFPVTYHHLSTSGPVLVAPVWLWRPSKGGWHPRLPGWVGSLQLGLSQLLPEPDWGCRSERTGSLQSHREWKGGTPGRTRGCCWHRYGGNHGVLGCWGGWGCPGSGASLGMGCGLVRLGG